MPNKIIVTADSTCDLTPELLQKYGISTIPLHINYNDTSHYDNVDITPSDIYNKFDETGELPKTASISIGEYKDFFEPFINDGYEIIHLNIGSGLSACYQNAMILSKQIPELHPFDSRNLSTGTGLIAIKAVELAKEGMKVEEILPILEDYSSRIHGSFILDRLNFLAAGGRCSSLVALGANLLKLKPCIEISYDDHGTMTVGKKFRGKYVATFKEYIDYKLSQYEGIIPDKVYFTHASLKDEDVSEIIEYIKEKNIFSEVFVCTACCTISSHCGPYTAGIFFITEK
ncbi:MAG: DegV family protein [Clostridia bacterium]|nr:DegV family protein [Clostridia bacterium]